MSTLQNRFHELSNWHQKIIFSTIMAKEILLDEDLTQLPELKSKEILARSINILNKVDQYVIGADKAVDDMKSFLYKRIPPDTAV